MTTFQAVKRFAPDVRVLWLDAHGDFNTPATTPSEFLGGMCLAAACGRWDAGFEPSIDPARVVMCGVRDLDAGEQVEVVRAGVGKAQPSEVAALLEGFEVYVHLDLDVLDPEVLPSQFAVPGGLERERPADAAERGQGRVLDRRGRGDGLRSAAGRRGARPPDRARRVDRGGDAPVSPDGLSDPRRLAALAETGLVDSPPEQAFDRVTRLVAEVLQVPVALFTLVTDERQVFKSSVGVGELR